MMMLILQWRQKPKAHPLLFHFGISLYCYLQHIDVCGVMLLGVLISLWFVFITCVLLSLRLIGTCGVFTCVVYVNISLAYQCRTKGWLFLSLSLGSNDESEALSTLAWFMIILLASDVVRTISLGFLSLLVPYVECKVMGVWRGEDAFAFTVLCTFSSSVMGSILCVACIV